VCGLRSSLHRSFADLEDDIGPRHRQACVNTLIRKVGGTVERTNVMRQASDRRPFEVTAPQGAFDTRRLRCCPDWRHTLVRRTCHPNLR